MQGASMGGGQLPMGLGPMQQQASAGGGGLLSGLFGGGGEQAPSGGRPWGPMLMALGGGIAGGASQGWGAGIGSGLQGAALMRQRHDETSKEDAYRQQLLKMKQAELDKGEPGTDDMREFEYAKKQGFKGGFMDFMAAKSGGGGEKYTDYILKPDGTATHRPGGGADPKVVADLTDARGRSGDVPLKNKTDAIKADQAFTQLSQSLDEYQTAVEKTGNVYWDGSDKQDIEARRANIILQAKELYGLGVLNPNDEKIINDILYNPTASANPFSENFGVDPYPTAHVQESVKRFKDMARQKRNALTRIIGMPDVPAPKDEPTTGSNPIDDELRRRGAL
jgi:hypothetical protein